MKRLFIEARSENQEGNCYEKVPGHRKSDLQDPRKLQGAKKREQEEGSSVSAFEGSRNGSFQKMNALNAMMILEKQFNKTLFHLEMATRVIQSQ